MPECGKCQGTGITQTKFRVPSPDGTVEGHYGDKYPEKWTELPPVACAVCLGTGKVRKKRPPRPEQGAIHFHIPGNLPPNTMSMSEIMDRLEERNQR